MSVLRPDDDVTAPLGAGDPVLAFDVGGTDIKAALIDATGAIREFERVPTPPVGLDIGDGVVASVTAIAREFSARNPDVVVRTLGILVPGEVDVERGVAIQAENMGWRNEPIRDRLARELSLPVAFGHDVVGAGEAEKRLGAGAGFDDVVYVSIGTGISCAVFIHGRPYLGTGMAGEVGHLRVAEGPECRCGGHGCIEAIGAAAAMVRRYNETTDRPINGTIELLERIAGSDESARAVWESGLDALALGMSYLTGLLAPEAIVLGGGLCAAGERFFLPLTSRLDSLLTFQSRPRLLPATLGRMAGIVGAAMKARELRSLRTAS